MRGRHSPRQAGGDTEQVHDVTGVTVLAENHLQNTEAELEGCLGEERASFLSARRTRVRSPELMYLPVIQASERCCLSEAQRQLLATHMHVCLCGYMHKHVCARMHICEKAQSAGSEVAERRPLVSMEMRVPRAMFRTEGYFSKPWALGCHMGNFSFGRHAPFTGSVSGALSSRRRCSSRLAHLDSCNFFLPGSVPTSSYPRHAPE